MAVPIVINKKTVWGVTLDIKKIDTFVEANIWYLTNIPNAGNFPFTSRNHWLFDNENDAVWFELTWG